MSQLWLLDIPEDEWGPDPDVGFEEEPPTPYQLLIPEIDRLQRAAEARRERRTRAVPSRSAYLPGDRGDPPRRAGVIQPRRFSSLTMLKAVPGIVAGFFDSTVPEEMWTMDADPAGPIAVVACPCGAEVEVPEAQTAICDCGLAYLNAVGRILMGNERCEPSPGQAAT